MPDDDAYENVPVADLLFDLAVLGATYEARGQVLIPTGERACYTPLIEALVKERRSEIIAHLAGKPLAEVEARHQGQQKASKPAILTWTEDEHLEMKSGRNQNGSTWFGKIQVVQGSAQGYTALTGTKRDTEQDAPYGIQPPYPPWIRVMSEEERRTFKVAPVIQKAPKKVQKRQKGA